MSLRTIEAALYARLQTLLTTASPAGYVAAVVRVAGDREAQAKLEQDAQVTSNLVALALDRTKSQRAAGVTTLTGASSRTEYLTRWRVKILVRDTTTFEHALTTANTGLYALMDAVLGVLDGFEASGIAVNTRVRFAEDESARHKPGRYIASLFFETRHWHDADDTTATGETPLVVNADVNLEGQEDTEPNPVAQLTTE